MGDSDTLRRRWKILWWNFVNRGIQRRTRGCGENDIIKLKSDCLLQIIIALLLQFCKAIALMSIAAPKSKRPYKFMSHPFPPRSSCVVFPPWKLGGGGGAASVNLFAGENTISVLCKLYWANSRALDVRNSVFRCVDNSQVGWMSGSFGAFWCFDIILMSFRFITRWFQEWTVDCTAQLLLCHVITSWH